MSKGYFKKEAFDFWGPLLPKRIKMRRDVNADYFPGVLRYLPESLRCKQGQEYDVELNQYGAVTAVKDGKRLGLKPSEFDVIETFNPVLNVEE